MCWRAVIPAKNAQAAPHLHLDPPVEAVVEAEAVAVAVEVGSLLKRTSATYINL